MKRKFILGIDVAKATFCFRLEEVEGALVDRGQLPNTPSSIKSLLKKLQEQTGCLESLHVGMEATGRYGDQLFALLHEAGAWVSVINPAQVKYFAASHNRRGKSDPQDATLIAHFVRERNPRATVPVDAVLGQLKELVGEIDNLVEEQTRLSNRLGEVASASKEVARSLRRRQEVAAQEIRRIEKAIASLLQSNPNLAQHHSLLCTIKGIASRTACRVLVHLAGKAFHSARQMAAYAGLTPKENTSGTSLRGKAHLCKLGNSKLRRALYMPATVLRRHNAHVAAWSNAIALRTGSKKAALGAVMRKLIHIIFGVLKHRQPFNPSYLENPSPIH
jgi:transposase